MTDGQIETQRKEHPIWSLISVYIPQCLSFATAMQCHIAVWGIDLDNIVVENQTRFLCSA